MELSDFSIHAFIQKFKIKTERGVPLDFKDHPFLFDIYRDMSQKQVIMKAAQVGLTLLEMIKLFWVVSKKKLECIFTMPTDNDVSIFVGARLNSLIQQNPIFQELCRDRDTVETKKIGENTVYFKGCVDDETEILTENGWCRRRDVSIGDRLPTLDIKTGTVEMDCVLDKLEYAFEGDMVRVENQFVDQLLTPDHRCVVAKRKLDGKKSDLRILRAKELLGKMSANIPIVFKTEKNVRPDPLYAIVGWVIGDGNYWVHKCKSTFRKKDGTVSPKVYEVAHVCIIQKKLRDQLENDLFNAGIRYHVVHRKDGTNVYKLSVEDGRRIMEICPDKKLSYDMVFKMSVSQMKGVLHGLLMSDGDNYNGSSFWQNKNGTCDALQAMLVILGRTSNKSICGKQERVRIKGNPGKREWSAPYCRNEQYKGFVWCPTTGNGTVFIRRNGKVSVTGQTHTKRAAISVPADLLIHDELDASNQMVVEDYETRLQHSKHKMRWVFSHPSFENVGAHKYWLLSDQKHWFITCEHCQKKQYLSWPESICTERLAYVCKGCNGVLSDDTRRRGEWVQKYKEREWSGYWINALMCPWISAKEIVDKFNTKDPEYFYTKVLGLPYVGEGNKLNREDIMKNVSANKPIMSTLPVVIGVDTGIKLHYVVGCPRGFLEYGEASGYEELEDMFNRYPRAIFVFDQGGDLIGPRKFRQKHRGKVYLCHYEKDRKTMQLIRWGSGEEEGNVKVDRNRMISMIVGEFQDSRLPLFGTEEYWEGFWQHAASIYRVKEENQALGTVEYRWERSGADHFFHALLYSRVGLSRVKDQMGAVVRAPSKGARSDELQEGIHLGPTGKSFHNLRIK